LSLDELIKHLTDINSLVTAEEKMSAFFKEISKTVSDFDTETSCLLGILHTQRDQQVTVNIYVRVCVCVRACVRACVCVYSLSF